MDTDCLYCKHARSSHVETGQCFEPGCRCEGKPLQPLTILEKLRWAASVQGCQTHCIRDYRVLCKEAAYEIESLQETIEQMKIQQDPVTEDASQPLPAEVESEAVFAKRLEQLGGYTTVGIVHARDLQWLKFYKRLEENGEIR